MPRLLLLLIVGFVVSFGILTFASTMIGRGMDTAAAIALLRPQQTRSDGSTASGIAVFDLNRRLRANSTIPLADVRQTSIDYTAFNNVFVTTYSGDSKARDYRAGFYEYNYLSNTVTPIDVVQSDRQMNLNNGLFYSFTPMLSQDGQRLTFINPADKKPYVFDRVTQQMSLLADVEISLMDAFNLVNWSPDGTRVAIQDASELLIFNADGSKQLTYQLKSGDSFGAWSPDGRYILLQRPLSNREDTIDVIDVATGDELPLTEDVNGEMNGWWDCDGQGIIYTSMRDDLQQGFLLNLDTGETLRLNDDPALEEVNIEAVVRLEDCKHLMILNMRSFSVDPSASTTMQMVLYLFDVEKQQVVFNYEVTTISEYAEDALYYEKLDSTGSRRQIMEVKLDPLSEPVVVAEYEAVQAAWINWSPGMAFATYLGVTSSGNMTGALHVLDLASGQSHMLTTDDEYVELFTTFYWRELECGELC